jgi:hypothetical protein
VFVGLVFVDRHVLARSIRSDDLDTERTQSRGLPP